MERLRIYLTGVGGQGTLTVTALLANMALRRGLSVVSGEIHGMAQRGGVVESTVLLGGFLSPRIDFAEADVLLGFEPLETLRAMPYLAENGVVLSSLDPLPPAGVVVGKGAYPSLNEIESLVKSGSKQAYFLACRELGQKAGSVQSGNIALLAAACKLNILPFTVETLKEAVQVFFPLKIQAINLMAVALGEEAVRRFCK